MLVVSLKALHTQLLQLTVWLWPVRMVSQSLLFDLLCDYLRN